MENNNNIFLGKIEKSGCYVNNGKYGYFITCGKKKTCDILSRVEKFMK